MFFRKPLFKDFFITSIIIAVLHFFALKYYLYWTLEWFDIVMHTLGGFLIALIVIFILNCHRNLDEFNDYKIFLLALVFGLTLSVGLAWELWEIFVGFTDTLNDLGDTVLDIVMDMVGAVLAIYYSRKYIWKNK